MTTLRILIVDDSENDFRLIARALRGSGYELEAERVDTPEAMAAALDAKAWDAVLTDYRMPRFSAPDALALLHERGLDLPFVIVSGTIGEQAAVAAMKAGAHDYVMKDDLARLVPAIERGMAEVAERRARREAEQALRAQLEFTAAITNSLGEAVCALDREGRITFANRAAEQMLGWTADEVRQRDVHEVIHAGSAHNEGMSREDCPLIDVLQSQVAIRSDDDLFTRKDGTRFPVVYTSTPITTDGRLLGSVLVFRDMTERRALEEQLKHQALHDTLTELPNRALLHDRLQQAILSSRRGGMPLSVLVLDLDRFKAINDTLGHHHGDLLLRQLGARLRAILRDGDTVARLGGDEFAILLPGTDEETARGVVDRLHEELCRPFIVEGISTDIRASIGMALYPLHGGDGLTLLRRADIAMYEAKRHGAELSVYAAGQDAQVAETFVLTQQLRQAIEQDELSLHYQPKWHLTSGFTLRLEALLRWRHPERGFIPPDRFIPVAEQTGLIEPLTRWVFDHALRQARIWRKRGLDVTIAVNLSVHSLHDDHLVPMIGELLRRHRLPGSALEVEITESGVMADADRALEVLTQLRDMEIPLSIDDFGTGSSSLTYLKRLPVNEIKIDRSFVLDLMGDKNAAIIVRSVIDLGHNLGLRVTAEGVESLEVVDMLRLMGCDFAQGYHLCRPLPADEMTAWLSSRQMQQGRLRLLVQGGIA